MGRPVLRACVKIALSVHALGPPRWRSFWNRFDSADRRWSHSTRYVVEWFKTERNYRRVAMLGHADPS
jgi:hypothetical protein